FSGSRRRSNRRKGRAGTRLGPDALGMCAGCVRAAPELLHIHLPTGAVGRTSPDVFFSSQDAISEPARRPSMRRYSLIGTTIFTVCLVGILLATGPSRARAERKRARTNTQPHT